MISRRSAAAVAAMVLFCALLFQIFIDPAQAFRREVSTFKLENGLEIVVIPDHRAPVVTHMIWYRVGAADESPGESGLAHFLEHLLFKGTKKTKPGEFSKIVARVGGRDNAFTSLDYTAYFQRVAKDRLSLVMEMEADRMQNLVLTDDQVLPERDVVLEERRSRVDNRPESRLREQMNAAFYVSHPYGAPVIGWIHEISALDRKKAVAFYNKYYAPNNAVLIVTGDVTPAQVKALAEKYYGPVPAKQDLPKRVRPREPEPQAARRVLLSDHRASNPMLQRVYLTPSYTTAKPGEAEALQLLAEVLGGSNTSYLFRKLVIERKIATVAGSFYSGDGLDSGRIGFYAVPAQGKTLAQVEQAIDKAIAGFLSTTFDTAALERSKKQLIAEAIYAQDSQSRLARIYGVALTTGQTVKDVQEWPERIEKVMPEAVIAVAKKYFRLERSTTGYLLKPSSVSPDAAEQRSK